MNLVVGDIDALLQRPQIITELAAIVEAYAFAGLAGKALGHIGADALMPELSSASCMRSACPRHRRIELFHTNGAASR